jgi:hypothetical protein
MIANTYRQSSFTDLKIRQIASVEPRVSWDSRAICTILSWICLTTAGPAATPHRPMVLASKSDGHDPRPLRLAEERARKRAELLAATEKELARIAARVQRARSPLRGAAAIGQAVGAVLGRRHMAKHFQISNAEQVDLAEPHPGAPAPK